MQEKLEQILRARMPERLPTFPGVDFEPMASLVPRYYGFKIVKWIDEIGQSSPKIHRMSYIDRCMRDSTQETPTRRNVRT